MQLFTIRVQREKNMFNQKIKNLFYSISFILIIFSNCKKTEEEKEFSKINIIHPIKSSPSETITLPGNLKAWYEAPIYAQVSGYVKMWYKDYGAEVKKGDLLAEIEAPILDQELAGAKADSDSQNARYELAEVTANRYLSLKNQNAVSEQSISVAVADKNSEKAKLNATVQNLKKYNALINFKKIVAPFDGIVTSRNINVGDYVNKDGNISDNHKNTNLFTVSEIDKLRLFVSVPGVYANLLKDGLVVDLTVPQHNQKIFKANFLTTAKGFNTETQTVIAQFFVDNKDYALWPGSYATVTITEPVKKNILTIPTSALIFNENGTQVATVTKENKVHFKKIKTVRTTDKIVEVLDGISEDDKIINNPKASLLENDSIEINTEEKENSEKKNQNSGERK